MVLGEGCYPRICRLWSLPRATSGRLGQFTQDVDVLLERVDLRVGFQEVIQTLQHRIVRKKKLDDNIRAGSSEPKQRLCEDSKCLRQREEHVNVTRTRNKRPDQCLCSIYLSLTVNDDRPETDHNLWWLYAKLHELVPANFLDQISMQGLEVLERKPFAPRALHPTRYNYVETAHSSDAQRACHVPCSVVTSKREIMRHQRTQAGP